MIVVDANIVIYLLCGTPQTDLARQAYSADSDWIVPELWEPEVLNGLMGMRRGGLLDLEEAIRVWHKAAELFFGHVRKCDPPSVLRTAEQAELTAYDAYYVTLARTLGVMLVTEDRKIQETCPDVARSLKAFLGLEEGPPGVREKPTAYRTRRTRRKRSTR